MSNCPCDDCDDQLHVIASEPTYIDTPPSIPPQVWVYNPSTAQYEQKEYKQCAGCSAVYYADPIKPPEEILDLINGEPEQDCNISGNYTITTANTNSITLNPAGIQFNQIKISNSTVRSEHQYYGIHESNKNDGEPTVDEHATKTSDAFGNDNVVWKGFSYPQLGDLIFFSDTTMVDFSFDGYTMLVRHDCLDTANFQEQKKFVQMFWGYFKTYVSRYKYDMTGGLNPDIIRRVFGSLGFQEA